MRWWRNCSATCAASSRPTSTRKEIEFIAALPMTTTGKVQRKLLRLREEERARAAAS